ncbi:MAG: hypothetical protein EBT57_08865, partial [Verrucomicrobia bacterium]|nr:hypothetical protein [Verrucomicrobiota bacterium]
ANLLRLADILREVRRQIGSLQRQAGKARRHREIFEKLKRLDLALSARERDQLLLKIDELSNTEAKTKGDLERAHAAEATCELGVKSQRLKLEEADRVWREAEREVVAARAEEVRCGERASMQTQRAEELGATIERARGEIALAERQASAQEDLIRSLTAEMEKVSVDFQRAEQVCQEAQEQVGVARRNREEAVSRMESIRARRESARREAEGARARAHAEEVTVRQRSEVLERVRQELSEKEVEELREKTGLEELARRFQEAESAVSQTREKAQRAEDNLRRAEADLVAAEKRLSEAEAERTLARSREEAIRERSTGEAEVCLKVWMEKGQSGAEAIWPSLKIRPGYEAALALALGPVLDGVLVDDLDRMAEALEAGEAGPSGVLISKQSSSSAQSDWAEGAWNFVEGAPGWELILPRLLAGVCIVDTWEEARNLQQLRPEATLICRDGRMISPRGWQRRGRARPSRPGRQELETARAILERAGATVQEALGVVGQTKERIQEARTELERARSHEQSAAQARDEARREHDRRDALLRGLSSETGRRRAEIVRLEQEIVVHQRTASEKSS